MGYFWALAPTFICALSIGESDFVLVSDFARNGFDPFAVSSAAKASFGMKKDADMYLFWLVGTEQNATIRRQVIGAVLEQSSGSRRVPNIAVICIFAQ